MNQQGGVPMLRIAIVEDQPQDAAHLTKCLETFAAEQGIEFSIKAYADGMDLIEENKIEFDIILLDIEMPHLSGMRTAELIRMKDLSVCIIFVTNVAKYAIQSYDVDAFDYLMKPLRYQLFANKMKKTVTYVELHRTQYIWIEDHDGLMRVPVSEILLIEKDKNYLVYRTAERDYRERGSIADAETKVQGKGFAKVNSGCVVNLLHVNGMGKDTVRVRNDEIPISRQQRKGFQELLMNYIRDGVR